MATASSEFLLHDKLYTLDLALDSQHMAKTFVPLARERFGKYTDVKSVGIEVMRRRNQRCVIRYRIECYDPLEERRKEWRVIGKVYKAHRGERVFSIMKQLWAHGFARDNGEAISIPEPLAFSSSLCMLFQEEVPGAPVKTLLKQSPQPAHMQMLARTVAKLHQCPIVPGAPMALRDHLLRCHPRYPFLALACPELEKKIDYIIHAAERVESDARGIKPAPIHGDFHLGQVHFERDSAWLIDFDALSYSDPAADLGNLLVFMKGKVKRTPEMAGLIQFFLDEYFSIMDRAIAERIGLYEALTHLRRACKCLRVQEENWRRKITRMVEKSIACIEQSRSTAWMENDVVEIVSDDEDLEEAELSEAA